MKNIARIMVMMLLITILLMVNVCAVDVIRLATVNSSQTSFKVRFSGEPKVSDEDKVKATVTNDFSATINVTGLTMDDNIETVVYVIQNTSVDLSAELSIDVINSNTEYFLVESKIDKTTLAKGEATTVTITIELIKKPVGESVSATIGIQLTATAVQPTGNNNGNTVNNNTTNPSVTNTNINTNVNSNTNTTTNTNSNVNQNSDTISTTSSNLAKNSTVSTSREKDETPKTGNLKFIEVIWRDRKSVV